MSGNGQLAVKVRPDLTLDLGRVHGDRTGAEVARVIVPPETPLVDQLIDFVEARRDPGYEQSIREGAVALASLTVHFGSYYALLSDPARPAWPLARVGERSLISQDEMRRINVEASAAAERLILLYREDAERFWSLLRRAHAHLPRSRRRAHRARGAKQSFYLRLASRDARRRFVAIVDPEYLAEAREKVTARPERVIANALICGCWRNGPIESVHAGGGRDPLPLAQARISREVHRTLFAHLSDALSHGLGALRAIVEGGCGAEEWTDVALPFWVIEDSDRRYTLGADPGWSLTAHSAKIRLDGPEP